MSHIKWGILGTSYISEVVAHAIQQSQTSQLTAIGSRSKESAITFASKFSIPKQYDNYHDLINDKDIDVIYIGLPNHLHKEWIIRSAQIGKHVLCEKPLVISVSEMQEVISVVTQNKVFCIEALMYRFHPFCKKIEELISAETIGDVKFYQAFYSAKINDIANPTAGGAIRNLGCYPVSLVRQLVKAEPVEMLGRGRMNALGTSDNQASVILKFPNDILASISTADDLEMFWQFDIYGTKGSIKVVTNPWLPNNDNNILLIHSNAKSHPTEIKVTADKPLYTYQIDFANQQIMNNQPHYNNQLLMHSLGNTNVLENWLEQVKTS